MGKQLAKSEFGLVKEIIREEDNVPTFVYSILDSIIAGKVVVDCKRYPNEVYFALPNGVSYLAGNGNNLIEYINDRVALAKEKKQRFTIFLGSFASSHPFINSSDFNVFERISFQDHYVQPPSMAGEREKYLIRTITKEDLMKCQEFSPNYIQTYWGSIDSFMKMGTGVTIRNQNGEIVGECISIFRSSKYIEVDIFIDQEARGKGLGYWLGHSFIEQAYSNQLAPKWDCDVQNTSSIKLAKKLGFDNPSTYRVYSLINDS
ncbi:GNAT family N-acetyltransferase [Cytobacillus spongiae]|jgi:GNAT superfamily N-acetyltransferase|uniref:GNAT family N-acetyltransferase n=1 Tax=Cytobacillus spongiae TaxID=2901381 RepID=UPI001F25E11C|nr:GNAT family N-acetyltransferase [Cytobacillus spongiae]UII57169.1 GNAT family N-acetyltransferase [Cytobacillus spongiae]